MDIEIKVKPHKIDDKDVSIDNADVVTFSPTWNTRGQCVDINAGGKTYSVTLDHVRRALNACAQAN